MDRGKEMRWYLEEFKGSDRWLDELAWGSAFWQVFFWLQSFFNRIFGWLYLPFTYTHIYIYTLSWLLSIVVAGGRGKMGTEEGGAFSSSFTYLYLQPYTRIKVIALTASKHVWHLNEKNEMNLASLVFVLVLMLLVTFNPVLAGTLVNNLVRKCKQDFTHFIC